MILRESSLDDLLNGVYRGLLKAPLVEASKGSFFEEIGCVLLLTDPRARLSSSLERMVPFSGVGEFVWYLAGSDEPAFIGAYIPQYLGAPTLNGRVPGAYGPRLFGSAPFNQFDQVISILRQKRTSRRAVMQIYQAEDLRRAASLDPAVSQLEVPCTCTLQFIVRDNRLQAFVYMRSNDAYIGLPHDVFCFTMLQELAARALDVECGEYRHMVGSLHLYETKKAAAQRYLDEGWHKVTPMPPMPSGDQRENAIRLVDVERRMRMDGGDETEADKLPNYWRELGILLRTAVHYRRAPDGAKSMILATARSQLSTEVYRQHLLDQEHKIQSST